MKELQTSRLKIEGGISKPHLLQTQLTIKGTAGLLVTVRSEVRHLRWHDIQNLFSLVLI